MRFALSNILLPLALFPLLTQGAAVPEELVAVTAQGVKIHSSGPVVLLGSNSGQDGGKSKRGVGSEIAQRHPQDEGGIVVGVGVGASVDDSVSVDANVNVDV